MVLWADDIRHYGLLHVGGWYPPLRFANEISSLYVATIFILVGDDIILPYIMSDDICRYDPL